MGLLLLGPLLETIHIFVYIYIYTYSSCKVMMLHAKEMEITTNSLDPKAMHACMHA
jgi:hypothetical protein